MLSEALGRSKGSVIAGALASILLGAIFLAEPMLTGISIIYVVGGLLVLVGIVKVTFSFLSVHGAAQSILGGVLIFVVGLLCLLKTDAVSSMMTIIIGAYVVADGTIALSEGVFCARMKIPGGASVIIFAITIIICGFYVMFAPFTFVMQVAGFALIADGIFNIILIFAISKSIQEVRNTIEESTPESQSTHSIDDSKNHDANIGEDGEIHVGSASGTKD